MSTKVKATIEDLYEEKGKAELIDGEIQKFMPTGRRPSRASFNIALSLMEHERTHGGGVAVADNAGFIVDLPKRESFSPDAAWFAGAMDTNDDMDFFDGAPVFAVEVRSKNDYGAKAEREMAEKRRDYFAAGTLVVWDVDLLGEEIIKAYKADTPERPVIFKRGETANAEPAVPGWQMPVDDLFR
ncbi:MAG: Uma2 family endonuclease [Acidobacteriota bacterium]